MSFQRPERSNCSKFSEDYRDLQNDAAKVLTDYLKVFKGEEVIREVLIYSLIDAGKLLRPVLIAAIARAFSIETSLIRPLQLAIELVHASSLIHDDLPALDNDDFRRGKPSCHKVFGEGLALLVGDFMLVEANRIILEAKVLKGKNVQLAIMLSSAITNMCEGQILDLGIRDKQNLLASSSLKYRLGLLESINLKKTGALFEFCVLSPSLLGSVSPEDIRKLESFHNAFSLLFQLCDDLLDSKHDTKEGVYRELNYVDILGAKEAEAYADNLLKKAKDSLEFLGDRAEFLLALIDNVRNAA